MTSLQLFINNNLDTNLLRLICYIAAIPGVFFTKTKCMKLSYVSY